MSALFRSAGFLMLLALTLTGCIHRPPQPRLTARVPPPVEAVRQQLASQTGVRALRASFKLRLETGERHLKLNGVLLAQAPAQLRVEVLPLLGPPAAFALLKPAEASLYLPYSNDTFFSTPEPEPLIAHLSDYMLTLEDVVGLFLGRAPACDPTGKVAFRRSDDRFIVRCQGAHQERYRLALEPGTLRVTGIERPPAAQGTAFSAQLSEYRPFGQTWLPTEIDLQAGDHFSFEVRFDDVEIDPEIDPALWTLEPPDNARRARLEALFPQD